MIQKSIALGLAMAALSIPATASASSYWTNWVSEENGGPAAACNGTTEAATGAGCWGSYCDDTRLLCTTMPYGATVIPSSAYWSEWTSEETDGTSTHTSAGWYAYDADNYHVCDWSGTPGFVTGIRCAGDYCDDVSIQCSQMSTRWGRLTYRVGATNCGWSSYDSEEQGSIDFGADRFIAGVACSGSYCDNLAYYVCSMTDPRPIIQIGGAATASAT